MPHQDLAGRYIEALGPGDRHLYREVAVIMSRQNGKTELLIPVIVKRLIEGRRIMHTAQDRALPRETFYRVADVMYQHHPELFGSRNGRRSRPRYANGQEEIRLTNGGIYSIVAPSRSGARGPSRDLVIVDEVREMDTWDFIAAAKPTLTVSPDGQMLYLSNAGEEDSVVLNALRNRRDEDPDLAYLEWSASPERDADDPIGWAEANPALGHEPDGMGSVLATLESAYRTAKLDGTLGIFETEHLTRWVPSLRETLVDAAAWADCRAEPVAAVAPVMGVSLDPDRRRVSAAIAWHRDDGGIGLETVADLSAEVIDTDEVGKQLRDIAAARGVRRVAYDPLTDGELAKYFRKPEPVTGQKFANASSQFAGLVAARALRWQHAETVGSDLTWTARKLDTETGRFDAVRANDDRPIPAALAAIRAVWLASGLRLSRPRVM